MPALIADPQAIRFLVKLCKEGTTQWVGLGNANRRAHPGYDSGGWR
jgi:hypothetical protein